MTLRPVNDRIIIVRDAASGEVEKKGLLYIPPSAEDKPQTATVVAVGTGAYELRERTSNDNEVLYTYMPVKAGDRIIIGKYSGAEIEHGGKHYTIIGPSDILAVVED